MDKRYLKELIEKERKAGVSVSLIRDKLVAKGYPKDVIDDVLDLKLPDYKPTNVKLFTIWIAIFAILVVSFIFFYNVNLGTIPIKPGTIVVPVVEDKLPALTMSKSYLTDAFIPGISECMGMKETEFKQCLKDLAINSDKISYCTLVKDSQFQKECNLEFLRKKHMLLYCDSLLANSFADKGDLSVFVSCSENIAKSATSLDECGSNEVCRAYFLGLSFEDYCLSDNTYFVPKAKCFAYFKRLSSSFALPKDYDVVVLDKQNIYDKPATCDLEGTSFMSNFGVDFDVYVEDVLSNNCDKYTGLLNQQCIGAIQVYDLTKVSCKESFLHFLTDYFVSIREKGWLV
jgi:hypothetical protein